MPSRYHGPKFSAAKRQELQAQAYQLRQQGATFKSIAAQLGVSHTTAFYWVQAYERERVKYKQIEARAAKWAEEQVNNPDLVKVEVYDGVRREWVPIQNVTG